MSQVEEVRERSESGERPAWQPVPGRQQPASVGVGETGAMTETIKQPSTPAAALDPPVVVFVPPCQVLLGTAVPPARDMLLLIPFPFIV